MLTDQPRMMGTLSLTPVNCLDTSPPPSPLPSMPFFAWVCFTLTVVVVDGKCSTNSADNSRSMLAMRARLPPTSPTDNMQCDGIVLRKRSDGATSQSNISCNTAAFAACAITSGT